MTGKQQKKIESTDRVFDILEELSDQDEPTISSIAEQIDCSESTVYYHLTTLEQRGYIRHVDGKYKLGFGFLKLAETVRENSSLAPGSRKLVKRLADETQAFARLMVPEGISGIFVYQYGTQPVELTDVSTQISSPLSETVYGRAILAFRDDKLVERTIAEAAMEEKELLDQLDEIRSHELAVGTVDGATDVAAVASPIIIDGTAVGSIGITSEKIDITDLDYSLKVRRFTDSEYDYVRQTANDLAERMQERRQPN